MDSNGAQRCVVECADSIDLETAQAHVPLAKGSDAALSDLTEKGKIRQQELGGVDAPKDLVTDPGGAGDAETSKNSQG
jgi:hypothetical protein